MTVLEAVALLAGGFAAGAINAVAGGGSLVSFPVLLAVGYPAKTANVTNTVALLPGYLGGSIAYGPELRRQRSRVIALAGPSVAGAIAGSAVLLLTPGEAFEAIVPFLILFAAVLMVFQGPLAEFAQTHRLVSQGGDHIPTGLYAAVFGLAVYGAYFGAGLGIITLAFLAILLPDDIQHSNALKGILSLIINVTGAATFVIFGPVRWVAVLIMALGALAGGYLGVGVARRLGATYLRWAVVVYAVVVAGVLLLG
jgi:uncharacterized membrane protein YfcA